MAGAYSHHPSALASHRADPAFIAFALSVLIPLQYGYSLFFNIIPTAIRLPMAGSFLIAYIFIAMSGLVIRPGNWRLPFAIAIACPMITFSFAYAVDPYTFDVRIAFRESLPFIAAIAILSFPRSIPYKTLRVLAAASLIIAAIQAFGGEPYVRGDIVRLHPFTGGPDGLHSSSFFIFGNMIIIDQLRRHQLLPQKLAWALFFLGLVLIILFKVRTTGLMLVIYFAMMVLIKYGKYPTIKSTIFFFIYFSVLFALAYLLLSGIDVGVLGSGRLDAYWERFNIMMHRDVMTFVMGSGPGSDFFTSALWSTGGKDSHNDFIHTIIERGIVGVFGLICFLLALFIRLSGTNRALLYAVICGSLVSNAFFSRPANTIYIILAMSIPLAQHMASQAKHRARRK